MIALTADTPLRIALAPQDFRKGIDGFVYLCRHHFKHDPRNGCVYVFINRSKTMVRLLAYDHNGYWLMTKRLSRGKFTCWPKGPQDMSPMMAKYLRQLLRNEATPVLPLEHKQTTNE